MATAMVKKFVISLVFPILRVNAPKTKKSRRAVKLYGLDYDHWLDVVFDAKNSVLLCLQQSHASRARTSGGGVVPQRRHLRSIPTWR